MSNFNLQAVPNKVAVGKARLHRLQWAARRRSAISSYVDTHETRLLQLGTGMNLLPGWLNTDVSAWRGTGEVVYLDARKRFPLDDRTFDAIFSEHMIEHISYRDGHRCLEESFRVLRPGGTIRIATPSLRRLLRLFDPEPDDVVTRYIRWSVDTWGDPLYDYLPGYVVNNFFRDWGHQFIYDEQTLGHALESVGFTDVEVLGVGHSRNELLTGLERHLPGAGTPEFNLLETMVLEARRP